MNREDKASFSGIVLRVTPSAGCNGSGVRFRWSPGEGTMEILGRRWVYVVVGVLILTASGCARMADGLPGLGNDRNADSEDMLVNTS